MTKHFSRAINSVMIMPTSPVNTSIISWR